MSQAPRELAMSQEANKEPKEPAMSQPAMRQAFDEQQ